MEEIDRNREALVLNIGKELFVHILNSEKVWGFYAHDNGERTAKETAKSCIWAAEFFVETWEDFLTEENTEYIYNGE